MYRLSSTVLAGLLAFTPLAPAPIAAPAVAAVPAPRAVGDTAPVAPVLRPAAEVEVLGVGGAGPYRIGARLDRLVAAGLIDWRAPGCSGVEYAGATGVWAGVIMMAFRDGRLVSVGTATVPPRSPAGAAVGMSFDDLEAIYGSRGGLIRNDAGDAEAYLVRFGSRVELFTGHPIRPGVGYYEAGPASFVEVGFRRGASC